MALADIYSSIKNLLKSAKLQLNSFKSRYSYWVLPTSKTTVFTLI